MSGRTPRSRPRLPSSPPCLALHDHPQSQGTSGAAELLQRRSRGREHAHVAARSCAQRSARKNFSPMPHAVHIRRLSSSLRTRLRLPLTLPFTSTCTCGLTTARFLALVAAAVLVSRTLPPPARRRSPALGAAVPLPVAPRTKRPAAALQQAATLAWSRSADLTRATLLRILRPGHGEVSAPCRSSLGAELLTPRRGAFILGRLRQPTRRLDHPQRTPVVTRQRRDSWTRCSPAATRNRGQRPSVVHRQLAQVVHRQ